MSLEPMKFHSVELGDSGTAASTERMPPAIETKPAGSDLIQGLKAGVPVAIGYVPIAITFGLVAKSSGIPNSVTLMMSFFIYAGASQFIGVNLIALGVSHWEIIMTTFIMNLRHFLMSASISQRVPNRLPKGLRAIVSFGITDETFTVASLKEEHELSAPFLLGLNLLAFSAWNAGTWAGVFITTGLPHSLQSSMSIGLYAMFIGLVVPSIRQSKPIAVISGLAACFHSLLHWCPFTSSLSAGWQIILTTVVTAAIGARLFPKEEDVK